MVGERSWLEECEWWDPRSEGYHKENSMEKRRGKEAGSVLKPIKIFKRHLHVHELATNFKFRWGCRSVSSQQHKALIFYMFCIGVFPLNKYYMQHILVSFLLLNKCIVKDNIWRAKLLLCIPSKNRHNLSWHTKLPPK